MQTTIDKLTIIELRKIITETVQEALSNYIEDLQALSSPNYIASVQESRNDYKNGKIIDLEDLISV